MKEEKGISRRIKQLALVLAALLAAGSASAADDREARYQAALDAMLENIHDPEANYEFALVARKSATTGVRRQRWTGSCG
jgi:hypothetical protein